MANMRRKDEGFTLIELMVVLLIIAILLAIAIPIFLGARNRANSVSAQSNLRNALTDQQMHWANSQSWDIAPSTSVTGSVANLDTPLVWTNTAGVKPGNTVLVTDDTSTNDGVILTAAGKDDHCYSIEVINQPVTSGAPANTYFFDSGAAGATTTGCSVPTVKVANTGPAAGNASSAANLGKAWAGAF